jgi:capsular polysaccharide biosynthesis protein
MELRTHVNILKRAKWFIILFTLAVGVSAFVYAIYRPVSYAAVVSFDVQLTNRPETTDYQYGAYYDLKAAEVYTQHLMSWLLTPAVVEEIYQAADISYTIDSIPRFTNRFKTHQYSAQNFDVEFHDYNRETAEKLADAVATVISTRSDVTGSMHDEPIFTAHPLNPVVAADELNPWFMTVIGLIAGLMSSLVLVYLREYIRE